MSNLTEISLIVDPEAAEAVSELFNRYNGGGWEEDSAAGEASGGGAVIEATGLDDDGTPIDGKYRLVVKTYVKSGARGNEIRRKIEEGLWHLGRIYPMPEPQIRTVRQEDWAHSWKQFYKPLRIGQRVWLKPSWEAVDAAPGDVVIELEPGMAFGTGMHPTTRLCVAALEARVQPGTALLDVGTGSGVLAVLAAKLGAQPVVATDIDPLAVDATQDNARRNGLAPEAINVSLGSVPSGQAGAFDLIVTNILARIIIQLFDGAFDNVPLAQPLAPGGTMILSGILDEQAQGVIDAAARHGLAPVETLREEDWVALVMGRG